MIQLNFAFSQIHFCFTDIFCCGFILQLDEEVLEYLVKTNTPFFMLENENFQHFVSKVQGAPAKLMTRKTANKRLEVRKTCFPLHYVEVQAFFFKSQ